MAKSATPKFSAIVPRKRLFSALDKALSNGSVWIGAQPGAGKTALVGSYLAVRRLPVLWYQVAAADADPSTFFYRIAQEAERLRPRLRRQAPLPLFTPEYAADLPGFAGRFFIRLFDRLKQPCALVFDNVNEVQQDGPLGPILRALLDVAPRSVNIICTSREAPPDALSRAVNYGTLHLVGWEELALQVTETAAIAAAQGVTEPGTVAALHRHCGSWVAGLTLLLQRMRAGADNTRRRRDGSCNVRLFRDRSAGAVAGGDQRRADPYGIFTAILEGYGRCGRGQYRCGQNCR